MRGRVGRRRGQVGEHQGGERYLSMASVDAGVAGKGVAGGGRGSAAVLCGGDGTPARGSGGDWVDELQEVGCELAMG